MEEIFFLRSGRRSVAKLESTHIGRNSALLLGVITEVVGGGALAVNTAAGPGVALFLNLTKGRPPSFAVTFGDPFGAMADQKINDVGRETEIIVKAEKDGNVGGSQFFPQTAFDFSSKTGELAVFGELFGNVGILVRRLFVGGFGEIGGSNKADFTEGRFSGVESQTVPAEFTGQGAGGQITVFAQQSEIKESSIAVAAFQEAFEGLPGEADAFIRRVDENTGHGEASFLRLMGDTKRYCTILHEKEKKGKRGRKRALWDF